MMDLYRRRYRSELTDVLKTSILLSVSLSFSFSPLSLSLSIFLFLYRDTFLDTQNSRTSSQQ